MKHLLIAASILAMTAGVASADITFSGSASAGIAKNGTANSGTPDPNTAGSPYSVDGVYHAYSDFDLAVSASGATDSGLTFGATVDIHSGVAYTLAHDDGFDLKGGTQGWPSIFISGSFGKITFSANNIDAYNTDVTWSDTGTNGDVKYEGTFGSFNVGLVTDLELSDSSVMVGYTMGALALSADYNQDSAVGCSDIWDASAAYTMGAFTGTLSATNDNNICMAPGYDTSETLKLAYSSNGIGAWVKGTTAYTGSNAEFAVGGSYASGPVSLTVEIDDVTQANHTYTKWTVTGGYDLGNGLALTAGANYTDDVMIGATMKF